MLVKHICMYQVQISEWSNTCTDVSGRGLSLCSGRDYKHNGGQENMNISDANLTKGRREVKIL